MSLRCISAPRGTLTARLFRASACQQRCISSSSADRSRKQWFAGTTASSHEPSPDIAPPPSWKLRRPYVDQWLREAGIESSTLTDEDASRLAQKCMGDIPKFYEARIVPLFRSKNAQRLDVRAVVFAHLMLMAVMEAAQGSAKGKTWSPHLQSRFDKYLAFCGIDLATARTCSVGFHSVYSEEYFQNTGTLLLRCCSHLGLAPATLDLGIRYRDMSRGTANPESHRTGLISVREDLRKLAKDGNVRAATLLAELIQQTDKPAASLAAWHDAVKLADDHPIPASTRTLDATADLEKPWFGLARLYKEADNRESMNAILRSAMVRGDADAYAAFAAWSKPSRDKDSESNIEWLNAVTKAAASGDFRSALTLGQWYANEAAPMPLSGTPSFWETLSSFLPSGGSTTASRYQDQVAAFLGSAQGPEERMRHALQWIEVAAGYGCVDATVKLAVLRSRKLIYHADNLSLSRKDPSETASALVSPFYTPELVRRHLLTSIDYVLVQKMIDESTIKTNSFRRALAPHWFSNLDVVQYNNTTWNDTWHTLTQLCDELAIDLHYRAGADSKRVAIYEHKGDRTKTQHLG